MYLEHFQQNNDETNDTPYKHLTKFTDLKLITNQLIFRIKQITLKI